MNRKAPRLWPLLFAVIAEIILVYQICRYQIRHGSFYHIEMVKPTLTISAEQPVILEGLLVNDAPFNLTVVRDHEHYGIFYIELFRADGSRVTQRPADWDDMIGDYDYQVIDSHESLSNSTDLRKLYVFGPGKYKAHISPDSHIGSGDQHILVGPFPGQDAIVDIDITP